MATDEITTIADIASRLRTISASKHRRRRPVPLDLTKLHAILSLDEISGIVHVEVGTELCKLEAALARAGLTIRRDPPLHPNARVFELLSELDESICGMEAVLPDGRVLRIRPAPRRATGPDILAFAAGLGTKLFVPCAVYLRARRVGDEPWVGFWTAPTIAKALQVVRLTLRRGVRPTAVEVRSTSVGAEGRIEINAPVQLRTASQTVFEEELSRVSAPGAPPSQWIDFEEVTQAWHPYADLARAFDLGAVPSRFVRFDPVGAVIQYARRPRKELPVRAPTRALDKVLDLVKEIIDPKGLLP